MSDELKVTQLVDLLNRYDACNRLFWNHILKENIGLLNGGCVHVSAVVNQTQTQPNSNNTNPNANTSPQQEQQSHPMPKPKPNPKPQSSIKVTTSLPTIGKQLDVNVLSSVVIPMKEYTMEYTSSSGSNSSSSGSSSSGDGGNILGLPQLGDIIYIQPLLYQANSISLISYYFRCKVNNVRLVSEPKPVPIPEASIDMPDDKSVLRNIHSAMTDYYTTEANQCFILDLEVNE